LQKIVVKEVRGPLGKGEKKFYAVVDDKDAEFTTFDTKITEVIPGSTLEVELKVTGKYVNIIEWKVVEEGKASVTPSNGKTVFGKTPEQFDAERRSTESQTAFTSIVRLIEQEAILKVNFVPGDLKELVFDWARARLQKVSQMPPQAPQKPKEGVIGESKEKGFENAGQFLTKCKEVFDLNRTQVIEALAINDIPDIPDFGKAYLRLAEIMTKK